MLTLIPVSLAQANEFVRQHHRHHKPVAGHKFSIGCAENGRLCAVAIVGRPVSRYLDDGFTLEVNRLCSDGTKNACSILYAAAARAARAMATEKLSPTPWTPKAARAYAPQAGRTPDLRAARHGQAAAVLPSRSIRRK